MGFFLDSTEDCADNHLLFINDIHAGIVKLNANWENDLTHSNHLKFSGGLSFYVLARLFPSFFRPSFNPHGMLRGFITPVLKDHTLHKHSSLNHQPINLSSNLLKLFEVCLFSKLGSEMH